MGKYDATEAGRLLVRAARAAGLKASFPPDDACDALLSAFVDLAAAAGFTVSQAGGGIRIDAHQQSVLVKFTGAGEFRVNGGEDGAFERAPLVWNPIGQVFEDAEAAPGAEPRSPLAILAEIVTRRLGAAK